MSTSQSGGGSSRPRRMLAAIMFTDVVGFSARMGASEVLTMQLVRRDLEFMQQQCRRRGGHVVKTTGDGLLAIFDSAVEAVRCALDIQTAMAEAGKRLGAQQALEHRIAVHLGDIIQTDDDVMGDGVNVAARLQPLAEPGGVCISSPTYEVIKNRLPFEAAYVGPCELKNIAEPIAVYKISPTAKVPAGAVLPPTREARGRGADDIQPRRRWMMQVGVGAAVLVVGAILVVTLMDSSAKARRATLVPPSAAPIAADALAVEAAVDASAALADNADYMEVRERFVKRYDFAGLAAHLLTHENLVSDKSARTKLIDRYQSLDRMIRNLARDLRAQTVQDPLLLPQAGAQPAWEVWMSGDVLHIREAGQVRQTRLEDIEPGQLLRLMAYTITEPAKGKKKVKKSVTEQMNRLAGEFGISRAAAGEYIREARARPS